MKLNSSLREAKQKEVCRIEDRPEKDGKGGGGEGPDYRQLGVLFSARPLLHFRSRLGFYPPSEMKRSERIPREGLDWRSAELQLISAEVTLKTEDKVVRNAPGSGDVESDCGAVTGTCDVRRATDPAFDVSGVGVEKFLGDFVEKSGDIFSLNYTFLI